MRTRQVLVFAVAAVAMTLVATRVSGAATSNVDIRDNFFSPGQISISAGDTVQWSNSGSGLHTATADAGQGVTFDSGDLRPGSNFSFTFNSTGTFRFHCQYHGAPGGIGMSGTVTVQGVGPTSTTTTTTTIPASLVEGFTWFADGSATKSGPSGTVVSAYGTGLLRDSEYVLYSSPANADPARACTVDPVPVNAAVRRSNNLGFLGRTSGAINRPPGAWDICFKTTDGVSVGARVRFTVL